MNTLYLRILFRGLTRYILADCTRIMEHSVLMNIIAGRPGSTVTSLSSPWSRQSGFRLSSKVCQTCKMLTILEVGRIYLQDVPLSLPIWTEWARIIRHPLRIGLWEKRSTVIGYRDAPHLQSNQSSKLYAGASL